MPGANNRIAATLARLEAALASKPEPAELGRFGEPFFLDFLFQIEARRLIRLGPEAGSRSGLLPVDLLDTARRAAAIGVLPVATPLELASLFRDLGRSLHESGAWHSETGLWWEPLGSLGELEGIHAALDTRLASFGARTSTEILARSFGNRATRRWLHVPSLLSAEFCGKLSRELESAFAAGTLELELGSVGAQQKVSSRRADAVGYLTGLEDELLEYLPRLAVLVQWCLGRLIPELVERLPETPLHPPVTAMLARYPGPSGGYQAHFDNPGGSADNGRELALVLYLNSPEEACVGGELELWNTGAISSDPPDERMEPTSGSIALMDSRRVLHRVRPLGDGPARWSLALWLNRTAQREFARPPLPALTLTDALLTIEEPPVARGQVMLHEFGPEPTGTLSVHRAGTARPRAGIVATVYGGGGDLDRWCRHHLALGFDHLVLVFDRLQDAREAETADRLAELFPASQLTIWPGERIARERWPGLLQTTLRDPSHPLLEGLALGGALPQAVASRQTLNATAALRAAATDELGGTPLDWLLHLDGDELLVFQGRGRGGADAAEHFSTLSRSGVGLVRYLNHEVLLSPAGRGRARFKLNPSLAIARLGTGGWQQLAAALQMRPSDRRPYFNGYLNGKSAVAVGAGVAAAGVHAWQVEPRTRRLALAGPAVLHFHFASAGAYCRKYLEMANETPGDDSLFEPCRTEVEGMELARALRRKGASEAETRSRLLALRDRLAGFTAPEVDLLEEAGLVFEPELDESLGIDDIAAPTVARSGSSRSAGESRPTRSKRIRPRIRLAGKSTQSSNSIGILGGGTAGYLTALALERAHPASRVTLIESKDIPIIGVGEATTPLLPQFLHVDLGLDIVDFFRAVLPTLKLGIRFDWTLESREFFNYPFGPMRLLEPRVFERHVLHCALRSMMMTAGVAPVVVSGNGGSISELDTAIGYHLDNARFVGYLQAQAEARGIERLSSTVSDVHVSAERDRIEALSTADGRRLAFDLYVDCSGFRSELLGKALGSPFLSYSKSLLTDRAVVARTANGGRIRPYTSARKMPSGWCWSTPQRDADHLGYVFSSSFSTAEEAELELRALHPHAGETGLVRFRAGRHREWWKGNVVALGNAYAFVEPLESTALHMLVRQIGRLVRTLPVRPDQQEAMAALNREVNDSWDYLSWFLALHYRFDRAPATPFWETCTREVDVSRHAELIGSFSERGPLTSQGAPAEFDYPDPLWGPEGIDLLLLGQGVPTTPPVPSIAQDTWTHQVRTWQRLVERAAPHDRALAVLEQEPRLLEDFVSALRSKGPAFVSIR